MLPALSDIRVNSLISRGQHDINRTCAMCASTCAMCASNVQCAHAHVQCAHALCNVHIHMCTVDTAHVVATDQADH